ncbi:hypothetical protein GOARA_059_00070 [Gordonia araii NBRC 100433]|uniref:Lipoprotein n=1 Tax=Gordonia araii NBRC 100433 TaxID=1073574 RepID=G7H3W6_9ACTN|nr:hypothetical protein [Gordonia araii]NNG99099.1 hypothetical protein [Gordonia araii NBRC 100433]GAB10541.1 hypothetical protein GOARA_059_00070 [Gordonia araii NBRC 100433]
MRRTICALAAGALAVGAGCAAPAPAPAIPEPYWLVATGCAVGAVLPAVDALVATGLRDTGYRRIVVESCAASVDRVAAEDAVRARGVALSTSMPERGALIRLRDTSSPVALRTELTAALMASRPWVLSGPPGELSPTTRAVVANEDVLELVRDERAARGGTVRENADEVIRSRANGLKGLIVALTNRRDQPADVTVAVGALGLSGTIRGFDAWSGQRFEWRDGRLGGLVGAGDTLLIRIT